MRGCLPTLMHVLPHSSLLAYRNGDGLRLDTIEKAEHNFFAWHGNTLFYSVLAFDRGCAHVVLNS